jgi:hypothetical protein
MLEEPVGANKIKKQIKKAVLRIWGIYPGSWIPDPNFSIPDLGSRVKQIPDPGSATLIKSVGHFQYNITSTAVVIFLTTCKCTLYTMLYLKSV